MLINPEERLLDQPGIHIILLMGLGGMILAGLHQLGFSFSITNYLTFHILIEMVGIVLATQVFGIVASSRHRELPANVVLVGMVFLAVAILSLSHMLSHPGMPVIFTAASAEKAATFWLLAQLLSVAALFAISVVSWRYVFQPKYFIPAVLLTLILTFSAHWILFLYPGWAPSLLLHTGGGPTGFRTVFSILLIGLFALTAVRLYRRLRHRDIFVSGGFLIAAAGFGFSELFMALFTDMANAFSLAGHAFWAIGCYFMYRGVFIDIVEHPHNRLATAQRRHKAILGALPDLMFEMDGRGRYLSVHTGVEYDLPVSLADLVGKNIYNTLPKAQAEIVAQALEQARNTGISRSKIIELDTLAGRRSWFELSVSYSNPSNSDAERFIVISRNITERVHETEQLNRLSEAVAQSPLSVFISDEDNNIIYVNEAFTGLTGYSMEEVEGKPTRLLYDDTEYVALEPNIATAIERGLPWQGEVSCETRDGGSCVCQRTVHAIRDARGEVTSYLTIDNDVTQIRQTADKLQQISNFDQLTGLPNRTRLLRLLDYLVERHPQVAVLWINLNRFKEINHALGHHVGDMVLRETADRFHNLLRPQDVLSRPVADDFVMVLCDAGPSLAAGKAQKVLDAMATPLTLSGRAISLSASVGISLLPIDANDARTLLQQSETAMHRCKEISRGSYCFFRTEMREDTARRLALTIALKQALSNNELHIEFQPQISLETENVIGAEALLRWHSPAFGTVSPAEFIPIAEESGSIIPIGEWVLRTAIETKAKWLQSGTTIRRMAVNISALQFEQPDFAETVIDILHDVGLPAQYLELELTEAVAMKTPETTAVRMRQLRGAGVNISIDDFGTGYSSLSYLKRFNINTIKIDRAFVRDITADSDDQAIVRAIIEMAHSMGMRTIAEGVETAEQLDLVRVKGCEAVQGFYFSGSLPPEQFLAFTQGQRTGSAKI